MKGDRASPDGSQDRNPDVIAIADLMALVAGAAFVLPLGEYIGSAWISAARVTEPWETWLRIGEFVSKLNIALVVLLLVRHARLGTMFRAAEWLMIASAMRSLHWRLVFAGGMDRAARWFAWGSADGRFRAWYTLGLVGFLAVVAVLAAFRTTLPLRLRLPLLAVLPLFALWGPGILASHEIGVLWRALRPRVTGESLLPAASLALRQSPEHMLVAIPFAAAVADLWRRGRSAWRWEDWTGFGLALFLASTETVAIVAAHARNFPVLTDRLEHLALWAGSWVLELAVAALIVRRLGGAWARWTSPGGRLTDRERDP